MSAAVASPTAEFPRKLETLFLEPRHKCCVVVQIQDPNRGSNVMD